LPCTSALSSEGMLARSMFSRPLLLPLRSTIFVPARVWFSGGGTLLPCSRTAPAGAHYIYLCCPISPRTCLLTLSSPLLGRRLAHLPWPLSHLLGIVRYCSSTLKVSSVTTWSSLTALINYYCIPDSTSLGDHTIPITDKLLFELYRTERENPC
jgi:hypothetical protein